MSPGKAAWRSCRALVEFMPMDIRRRRGHSTNQEDAEALSCGALDMALARTLGHQLARRKSLQSTMVRALKKPRASEDAKALHAIYIYEKLL